MLFAELDLKKEYSYLDYLKWTFEESVELIRGKVFKMSPTPSRKHQDVSYNLTIATSTYFKNNFCKVYVAPFDVRLPQLSTNTSGQINTVVQPDICVICDQNKLDDQGCLGAPDWIIEIISPSTRNKDLNIKYQLYEEAGVREYWIVHPQDQTVNTFVLTDDSKFSFTGLFPAESQVPVSIFSDLTVDLREVFGLNQPVQK